MTCNKSQFFYFYWRCFNIKQELPINGQIREKEVQLIGENGEKLGVISTHEALEKYFNILGIGISNLTMLLDPSCVVLGGDINILLKENIEYLRNIVYKDNLFTNEENCKIDVTEFKGSYLVGAAMVPLEAFLN